MHDERDLRAHLDYIHCNPVEHGLVTRVQDWPHSTFHRYVRAGMLAADRGDAVPNVAPPRAHPGTAVHSDDPEGEPWPTAR